MMVSRSALLVLDTNALAGYLRQNSTGQALSELLALETRAERPLLSSIVEGELRGLTRCWRWGTEKQERLEALLRELVYVDAGMPEVVEAYATLYHLSRTSGRPTGENDLWIAATTLAVGAELVTCDSDFLWLHPQQLTVHYVEARH